MSAYPQQYNPFSQQFASSQKADKKRSSSSYASSIQHDTDPDGGDGTNENSKEYSFQREYKDESDFTASQEMIEELNRAINNGANVLISIPSYQKLDNYVVYTITVARGSINWTLQRRYKEFLELHKTLSKKYKRSELPQLPSRTFPFGGSKYDDEILKERRYVLGVSKLHVLLRVVCTIHEDIELLRRLLEDYMQQLMLIADPEVDATTDGFLQFSKNFVLSIGPALCKIERVGPSLSKVIETLEDPDREAWTTPGTGRKASEGDLDSDDTPEDEPKDGSEAPRRRNEAKSKRVPTPRGVLREAFCQLRDVTLKLQSDLENMIAQFESNEKVCNGLKTQISEAEIERSRIQGLVDHERRQKRSECQYQAKETQELRTQYAFVRSKVEELKLRADFIKKQKTYYYRNFKRISDTLRHSRKQRDDFILSTFGATSSEASATDQSDDDGATVGSAELEGPSEAPVHGSSSLNTFDERSIPALQNRGVGYAGELDDLRHVLNRLSDFIEALESSTVNGKSASSNTTAKLDELRQESFGIFKNNCTDYNADSINLIKQCFDDHEYIVGLANQ